MTDLPRKVYKKPIKSDTLICSKCGGVIIETGETDWGDDGEGNVFGWLPDMECSKCGNYVAGDGDASFKDPLLSEIYDLPLDREEENGD